MLEDDGITAAIEELQSRLGDLQNSIDQALQVTTSPLSFSFCMLTNDNNICREEREEEYYCIF